MNYVLKRNGWWWRIMGFTRAHMVGVFATEAVLAAAGMLLVAEAFSVRVELMLPLLVSAACVFLLQIGVLLSSILSLLFYMGSRNENPEADVPKT